ncbi:hypothetical protein BD414DRAFT_38810 [Trametes punicea]|nr:hypothetical protein BD414DRAFT_38810 [Trametes punicea]
MPSPRVKGKPNPPKAKAATSASNTSTSTSRSTYPIPDAFFTDIDNLATWRLIVETLCKYLDLPDLGTRSGLKKVHANFLEISKRLDTVYAAAQKRGNERLLGAVVGIWAKMCTDAILRDKLFREGLLSKVMPLTEYDSTRHMALNALSLMTHHGGVVARREIALKNPILLNLIQAHPDDAKVLELATVTMAHATSTLLSAEDPPDSRLLKELQVRNVLKTTVESARKPIASFYMIEHTFLFLSSATRHCPQDCKATPGMLTLLVACLRSANLTRRCNALGGLIRYTVNESETDRQNLDPQRLIAAVQRRCPDHLTEILATYGFERCETTLTLRGMADHQSAMMRCAEDHDLCALGRTLATLIQRTEFSIAEGMFQADGPPGRREPIDLGLPFTMWTDALPHCATALRARGTPADQDMADVLDLKFFLIRSPVPDAVVLGQRVIERNPDLAYAYYAISMGPNRQQGLRAAKKGLKCKTTTPFVRQSLLWRAVEHAGDLGVATLQSARAGDGDEAEGIAFLMSAWEDAKTFTVEAPPDNHHMQTILNWYIILTVAIKGPKLSEDLRELADAHHKLDISEQLMNTISFSTTKTELHLTRNLILELYPEAVKEWGAFIKRIDELDFRIEKQKPLSYTQADDDLAAWIENMKLEDGSEEHLHPHPRSHPKISLNNVMLYRCSWCTNPSAVLRKCGGCGKTRYCDGQCQKKHWPGHKTECKRA